MTENANSHKFNADELQPSSWLNIQFIKEVLSGYEKAPELQVTDLQISPATAQGDHYASVMFRTVAEYNTEKGRHSKALIVKTMPEQEGHKKDMLSESNIFETEILMYSKALPEFERILRESGDNTKLYVPCIYHSLEPRKVMIFEDLVPQGYTVIRDRPATKEELKKAFTKLAKWHAVSMKVIDEQPDFLEEFKYGMWDMSTFLTDPMVTTGLPCFLEMLDQVPELTKYKPHFDKINSNYMQRMSEIMLEYRSNPQLNRYYVLCHGDFHLRNMMFKNNKETGASEDVMLVDFQISNICPITVDLTYSVYMLMEWQERCDLGKDLIDYYLSVLLETLNKVGYKGEYPTQSGLWEHIHGHKYYDFFLLTSFLPMIVAIKTNSIKMTDLILDPEIKQKTYFLDDYLKEVKTLLPKFEKMGYFNNL
ncbi:uncharacterized protein LOC108045683 [Drosophila rhopaloa]|uniref:Uncharacterized protein LOC108045683 n=1 Tax=Drosophila rhopaloa TaxID=1041015 RepID=A0A6P4EV13_DRORH|nr:uncharacterized protein LOC108045683 [Drosophila rhopaloa]